MLPNLMRSIARGGRSFVSRRNFSSSRGQVSTESEVDSLAFRASLFVGYLASFARVIYQDMDAALEQKQQAAASMELKEQEDDS